MVRATHSTLDNFGASGSGSRPPPPGLEELLATQNELLRQLVQGQQAISHFLQQQHFHLDWHKVYQMSSCRLSRAPGRDTRNKGCSRGFPNAAITTSDET